MPPSFYGLRLFVSEFAFSDPFHQTGLDTFLAFPLCDVNAWRPTPLSWDFSGLWDRDRGKGLQASE